MKHLIVEVVDVKGRCVAGYRIGDKFEINRNVCIEGEKLCYFAISSIMPTIFAMQCCVKPKEVGLSNEAEIAFMQCSDPGEPLTPGGTVTFKIRSKF